MKNTTSVLLVGLLGSMAPISSVIATDNVLSKEEVVPGSYYCHIKFRAIEGRSFATNNPVPKDELSGDIIDYYGPCDEDPVGQDQVRRRRLDFNHNWILNYSD